MKNVPSPTVSRRNFINIAVGTLTTLPAVAGGFLVPFCVNEALADEATAGDDDEVKAHLVVVKPYEVGIVVEDVSKTPDKEGYNVEGATIKLTSRCNGEALTGTTDKYGIYKFNITNLSEKQGMQETKPVYAFNGTIEITCPGYRDVYIPLVRVTGGTGLAAPTRPLEEGVPYPHSITLSEWDVLYTKNEFLTSDDEAYKKDHEFKVDLANVPDGNVSVSLYERDSKTVIATGTTKAASGVATVAVSKMFQWKDASNPSYLKKNTAYSVTYSVGENDYDVPIQLTVSEAEADSKKSETKEGLDLTPFSDLSAFEMGIHIPKGIPLIGDSSAVPWMPTWPVNVYFDPFGYMCVAYTSPKLGYKNDNGTTDPDGWQKFPRKSTQQQFDRWQSELETRLSNIGDSYSDKQAFKQIQAISVFSFGASFSVMGAAKYTYGDHSDHLWRGRFCLSGTLAADYSLTETVTVAFIPVLIQFNLHAAVTVAVGPGFMSPNLFEFKNYQWDYMDTGLTITIVVAPSLSVGVGVKGVASVSVRGDFSVSIFIGICKLPDDDRAKNPHVIVGIHAAISIVLQLLFYTKKWTLKEYDAPNLYDNWPKKSSVAAEAFEGDFSNYKTLKDVVDDMEIVTEGSLAQWAEFTSTGFSGRRGGTYATPTAFLLATEKELTTNGLQYNTKVYHRMEINQAVDKLNAKIGANGTPLTQESLVGTGDENEQARLKTLWKSQGLLPIWESDSTNVLGSPMEYALTGNRSYQYTRPAFGIDGLCSLGGVHITSDILISPDVLSDPRSKIVSIWGKPFVLRLASVMVGPEGSKVARTRIIAQKINTDGKPADKEIYLLDFDAGAGVAPRDDLFDYDFDVVATLEGDRHDLHLLVFSGLRGHGNDTDFITASMDHLASYVRWSFTDATNLAQQTVSCTAVDPDDVNAAVDSNDPSVGDWAHMYSCPQVRLIEDGSDRAVVMSYLDRAGETPADVFGNSYATTRVGVGMFYASLGGEFGDLAMPDLANLRKLIKDFDDLTVSEMTCSDRPNGGYHTVMLRGTENAHYLIVKTKASAATIEAESIGAESAEPEVKEPETTESTATESTTVEPTETTSAEPEATVVVAESEPVAETLGVAAADANAIATVVADTASESDSNPVVDAESESVPPTSVEAESDEQSESVEAETFTQKVPGFEDIRRVPDEVFAGNERMQLVAVPNNDYFLTAAVLSGEEESSLCKANWNTASDVTLDLNKYGPSGFVISKFCVHPKGTFIYWPAVRDGKAPYEYDKEQGDQKPQQDEKTYTLMGCRLRNGKFSDPFVLAQVDHPMDTLEVLEDELGGMVMLNTHVVDASTGQGDVYYTVIEHAVCASIAQASAVMPIVAPEDPVSFYVAIRNDGNVYIKGASISVEGLGSQKLEFNAKTTVESSWNPMGSNGKLEGVEDDYALAPGKTSLYKVDGYKVPKDWSGDYDLKVTIDADSVTPADDIVGVSAEAADAPYIYNPKHEDMKETMGDGTKVLAGQASLTVQDPQQLVESDLADAPVSVQKKTTPAAKKTPLSNTGDASAESSMLASALGLAGAALLAYSKRRSDLESERNDA